jgi:hypothetical protein
MAQDRFPLDEESQNPMFPDPFNEQSDEQYPFDEEQSDEKTSHWVEMENTQHHNPPNVLAQPQDYENNTTDTQLSTPDCTRVDFTFRNRYINYVTNQKYIGTVTTTYRSDVELLYLLQKSNVPIGMYDKIQKWARKSYAINPKLFVRSSLPRPTALNLISKKFDAKGCYPITVVCQLPSLKHRVSIQTFDLNSAVYSLLTDPILMREENLDLDVTGNPNTNPLYPFPEPAMYKSRDQNFLYKEFSDGELYCIAYNTYCRGKAVLDAGYLHMPLVIIGQLDKTFIDSKGKLTLEPFKISLHIFKEQVRRHDCAWRPIGYLCNQSNLPKYKNSADKASDYHYMIHQIMKSMKDFQAQYDFFFMGYDDPTIKSADRILSGVWLHHWR